MIDLYDFQQGFIRFLNACGHIAENNGGDQKRRYKYRHIGIRDPEHDQDDKAGHRDRSDDADCRIQQRIQHNRTAAEDSKHYPDQASGKESSQDTKKGSPDHTEEVRPPHDIDEVPDHDPRGWDQA